MVYHPNEFETAVTLGQNNRSTVMYQTPLRESGACETMQKVKRGQSVQKIKRGQRVQKVNIFVMVKPANSVIKACPMAFQL